MLEVISRNKLTSLDEYEKFIAALQPTPSNQRVKKIPVATKRVKMEEEEKKDPFIPNHIPFHQVNITIGDNNNNSNNNNSITPKCTNCLQNSHSTENCQMSRKYYCEKCKYYGHETKICSIRCKWCNMYGHSSENCKVKALDKYCKRCKSNGHTTESCKLLICNKCKQPGHFQRDCKK